LQPLCNARCIANGLGVVLLEPEGRCIPRCSSTRNRRLEIVRKVWRSERRDALGPVCCATLVLLLSTYNLRCERGSFHHRGCRDVVGPGRRVFPNAEPANASRRRRPLEP